MDWKDIAIRAGKTACQTFLAVLIPSLTVEAIGNIDKVALAAVIAAIAAGLSVVNNALIAWLKK